MAGGDGLGKECSAPFCFLFYDLMILAKNDISFGAPEFLSGVRQFIGSVTVRGKVLPRSAASAAHFSSLAPTLSLNFTFSPHIVIS